ncbi:electron transport complex subunit RsxC [Alkalicella caledoniensis]|uniref:Ion-translocating oxidoreductase complex subunit C n=1 Tax=Alkalicella caledoniensis TaxID=2731377 RepID=A0A7G9WD21_ALKCA|nr:electron transport complex subunit RsxC [Alkalicella caledoniensis]
MFLEKRSFKGGIHPLYNKELSQGKAIEVMGEPKKVTLPLQQHIGAPCQPIVEKGQDVVVGQKIAESDKFVSAPIHSSITGKVVEVTEKHIVIEGEQNSKFEVKNVRDIDSLTPEEIRSIVKEAGLVGMGGAAFPTHVKLSAPEGKKFDTILLNGAECEPYLTIDHRIMIEQPEKIVYGLRALLKATGAQKGYIGIELNKPDAIEALRKASEAYDNIEVATLEVKYPQGGEKQLIKAILDKEVPVGGLPVDVGALVNNVYTAAAIYEAIKEDKPLFERGVTITGKGVVEPKNLLVKVGTTFKEVLEQCGGLKENAAKIISGGPMMGRAVANLDEIVTKGTSGILVLTEDEVELVEEKTCIKCARCVDACPMYLMPNYLAAYSRKSMHDDAQEYHLFNCIECGCCSFVCPSRIPLVHLIRQGKWEINSKRAKK